MGVPVVLALLPYSGSNKMYYALIKNKLVETVIVADESFVNHIKDKYDYVVEVSEPRPSTGDSYYPETQNFVSNHDTVHYIHSNIKSGGTEETFKPVKLSNYVMSHEGGMIKIGCKLYSPQGLFEAVDKLLHQDESHPFCFTTNDIGPSHGKFQVTWEDTKLVYETLKRLKL